MKTDALIALLATGVEPVSPHAVTHRLLQALGTGVLLAVILMLLEYGVRPDLSEAMRTPGLWMKLMFPLGVMAAGFVLVHRLARPGARVGWAAWGPLVPVAAVWCLAALAWVTAPVEQRMPLLMGQTWRACAFSIGLIALPVFVAALLALRHLAPTRPAWAGAAAGAMAGGAGAAVYALHCPEVGMPFLAVWYLAGMLLPVLAGALLGPRLLRW